MSVAKNNQYFNQYSSRKTNKRGLLACYVELERKEGKCDDSRARLSLDLIEKYRMHCRPLISREFIACLGGCI
jgi:hypothetical protein